MKKELTRRNFVGVGLAAVACGSGISSATFALNAEQLHIDNFHAATYKLLGQQPADPFFARKIFAHVVEQYSASSLNALSSVVLKAPDADLAQALAANDMTAMASEIANTWYSGTVHAGTSKAQVIGYVDNLAWQAIKFSTPQSVCGGHFGHWHKLPTGQ